MLSDVNIKLTNASFSNVDIDVPWSVLSAQTTRPCVDKNIKLSDGTDESLLVGSWGGLRGTS